MNYAMINERENQVDLPSFEETDECQGDIVNIVVKEHSGDQEDFQSLKHTDACEEAILSTKRNAMFLFAFLGLKIIDFKIVLIQWFCLPIKTMIGFFRHKLDTVLCFKSKILEP